MSSIDKRIVQMEFDNQGFEKGVRTTMKSLDNLNESLKMKGATNNLSDIQTGLNKLTSIGVGALSSGLDSINQRFSALGVIGATALMNLTNSAVNVGKKIANSLTIEPITSGFSEYETKMNAIQTILTNTESKGTTMDDVTAALAELNDYADKTIYNFAAMTKNIGTFTAAGVDLETSVAAIKGIANLAAGSGANSEDASRAMYQLSQALAAGKVGLQDWNSVVNAGMGGELFRNALMDMAESMGIYVNRSIPFRETLQDNWLTSDVLIKTLNKFAEDESLLKAATQVKTFTELISTMQESVQSGWAVSWEHIIGNKEQAAELFTSISDGFTNLIQPSTDARNAMLQFWNEHGGRTAIINGITNVLEQLGRILKPIGDAWKEAFPAMTGAKLTALSAKFEVFTKKLNVSYKMVSQVKKIFTGLFDGVKLVKDAIVALIAGIGPLGNVLGSFISSTVGLLADFGSKISELKQKADELGVFGVISAGVSKAAGVVADVIYKISDSIASLVSNMFDLDFSGFADGVAKVFGKLSDIVSPFLEQIRSAIGETSIESIIGAFVNLAKAKGIIVIADSLKEIFASKSSEKEGGGILDSIKSALESFGGVADSFSDVLGTVKDALTNFQKGLKVDMLLKIATAIALLSASLLLVSSIDVDKLSVGLTSLAVLFVELSAAMAFISSQDDMSMKTTANIIGLAIALGILVSALKSLSELNAEQLTVGLMGFGLMLLMLKGILTKVIGAAQYMSKPAAGIIVLAGAILILSHAVEQLGSIPVGNMVTGLLGLGVLLAELSLFLASAKFAKLNKETAVAIVILSAALLVLQKAVSGFGSMNPDEIIKGLSSIAIILSEIMLFSYISKDMDLKGIGVSLTIISAALLVLGNALKTFGSMSWSELAVGLVGLAAAITMISVAADLLKESELMTLSLGLSAMAIAMTLLSVSFNALGTLSWMDIGKSLVTVAGSLVILAVAMKEMQKSIAGAQAMLLAAAALAVLTPQILMLSSLDLPGLLIALLAMAGAFTVLGVAGSMMTPLIPVLQSLASIIALLGLGAALAGVGLMAIGAGLTSIGVALGASGLVIVEFFRQLILLIPTIATSVAEGFVTFATTIATNTPVIMEAVKILLMGLLDTIRTVIPELVATALEIVIALADALKVGVPHIAAAALELILGLLTAIAENIQPIIEAGADMVIGLIKGIANKLPDMIQAAIDLAIAFIEGLAQGINNNYARVNAAIESLIIAMVKAFVHFVTTSFPQIREKGKELLDKFIEGCKDKMEKAKSAIKEILEGIKTAALEKIDALVDVGKNLITGFIDGIKSMATAVIDSVTGVIDSAITWAEKLLGINSPSKVFKEIGRYTSEGFAIGLDEYAYMAGNSASELANTVLKNVKDPLSNVSKILNDDIDVNPTITPVMDLTNIKNGTKLLNGMIGNQDVKINARSGMLAGTVGQIQNRKDNADIVAALKDLKEGLSDNGPSYTINGITYDDGSNVTKAVETLVRAARIERRL